MPKRKRNAGDETLTAATERHEARPQRACKSRKQYTSSNQSAQKSSVTAKTRKDGSPPSAKQDAKKHSISKYSNAEKEAQEASPPPHKSLPDSSAAANITSPAESLLSKRPTTNLTLTETTGDIFSAPTNTVLIHSCNSEGHWGAGIAKAFHDRYPAAYSHYHAHCHIAPAATLPGTALLIPPIEDANADLASPRHFIGCLFTSRGKGRTKDSPAQILRNTEPAMRDLVGQVLRYNESVNVKDRVANENSGEIEQMWMCKINSGLFKVKWEKTRDVLEGIELRDDVLSAEITVMSPA